MAVTKRLRFEILRRDKHACRYCGATAPDAKLVVDHVVPVALGGPDDPANLVTACRDCNSGKSATSPDENHIADVADDALRWAAARSAALATMRAAREEQEFERDWFDNAVWGNYRFGNGDSVPKPDSWAESFDQWRAAGLELDDIAELVAATMAKNNVTEKWRYFCGCCWTRIRQIDELTTQILREGRGQ